MGSTDVNGAPTSITKAATTAGAVDFARAPDILLPLHNIESVSGIATKQPSASSSVSAFQATSTSISR